MTLLAVERIKLFTTRSPWWCALITLVLTIGFAGLVVGNSNEGEFSATVTVSWTRTGSTWRAWACCTRWPR
jgi:ABC-2 type transport system permease protein